MESEELCLPDTCLSLWERCQPNRLTERVVPGGKNNQKENKRFVQGYKYKQMF